MELTPEQLENLKQLADIENNPSYTLLKELERIRLSIENKEQPTQFSVTNLSELGDKIENLLEATRSLNFTFEQKGNEDVVDGLSRLETVNFNGLEKLSTQIKKLIEVSSKEEIVTDYTDVIQSVVEEIRLLSDTIVKTFKFDTAKIEALLKIIADKEFPDILKGLTDDDRLKVTLSEEQIKKIGKLLSVTVSAGGGGFPQASQTDLNSLTTQSSGSHGAKSSIGTSAVQMKNSSISVKNGVMIKADSANTGKVYVGFSSSVTNGSSDTTDGFELSAGDGIVVTVSNVNLIYLIGSASGQKVYWLLV